MKAPPDIHMPKRKIHNKEGVLSLMETAKSFTFSKAASEPIKGCREGFSAKTECVPEDSENFCKTENMFLGKKGTVISPGKRNHRRYNAGAEIYLLNKRFSPIMTAINTEIKILQMRK